MKIVISQSMYFPWVGMLEQLRLSDIFIHYDDVQFSRGSFTNRVQIKTAQGVKWLTIPLSDLKLGQNINQVKIDNKKNWKQSQIDLLKQAYENAPFRAEMLDLVDSVFCMPASTLSELSRESILVLARYFGLDPNTKFVKSSDMCVKGLSSQRVHDLSVAVAADVYVTGHGARNYLDHDLFERSGIKVEYMKYNMVPYPQLHGDFTPYVSALDLVANCGQDGASVISSNSIYWKDFLNEFN